LLWRQEARLKTVLNRANRWSIHGLGTPHVLRIRGAVGAALLILSWMTVYPNICGAQKEIPLEYRVKATFLYNFTKFVTWPAETFAAEDAELRVTIVGEDPFGQVLDELASSAPSHGRKLVIERRTWNQDLRRSQVLFISRSEKRHLNAILANLKGASVLTVSEIEQFSESGGMIGFIFEQDQIRFEINLDAAVEARLEISSRLLALASHVHRRSAASAD
jgi:hypothetical protein